MSRIPPGLRITASLGEAAALNWLSQELFFGVEKFGHVAGYDSADGAVTVWSGSDSALLTDPKYPINVTTLPFDAGAVLGDAFDPLTVYVSSPQNFLGTIVVQGLGPGGIPQTGYVTASGQTAAPVVDADAGALLWTRVFRAWVETLGAGAALTDTLYIHTDATPTLGVPDNPPADTWALIHHSATFQPNQTLMNFYTIPAGHQGLIKGYTWSITKQNVPQIREANFQLQTRDRNGLFRTRHLFGGSSEGTSSFAHKFPSGVSVPELTDIRITVVADNADLDFTATFSVFVKK